MWKLLLAGATGASLALGAVHVNHMVHPLPSINFITSLNLVELRANGAPPGGVLVIGDSIAEMQGEAPLCGLPVTNASIAGSTVEDWLNRWRKLVAEVRPRIIVLALGTNEMIASRSWDRVTFAAKYRQLAEQLPGTVVRVIPQNVDPAAALNPTMQVNRIREIQAAVRAAGGILVEPVDVGGDTLDGVHLARPARARMAAALSNVCRRLSR